MTTMSVVGECFFWYRLTWVVPDNFHRAVKWLCVCVCVCVCISKYVVFTYCHHYTFFVPHIPKRSLPKEADEENCGRDLTNPRLPGNDKMEDEKEVCIYYMGSRLEGIPHENFKVWAGENLDCRFANSNCLNTDIL